jgi:hypothetical protein
MLGTDHSVALLVSLLDKCKPKDQHMQRAWMQTEPRVPADLAHVVAAPARHPFLTDLVKYGQFVCSMFQRATQISQLLDWLQNSTCPFCICKNAGIDHL